MTPAERRERRRRLLIRAAALRRHAASRDPVTGKSQIAVHAGRSSGRRRLGDTAWAVTMAAKRWYGDGNSG